MIRIQFQHSFQAGLDLLGIGFGFMNSQECRIDLESSFLLSGRGIKEDQFFQALLGIGVQAESLFKRLLCLGEIVRLLMDFG